MEGVPETRRRLARSSKANKSKSSVVAPGHGCASQSRCCFLSESSAIWLTVALVTLSPRRMKISLLKEWMSLLAAAQTRRASFPSSRATLTKRGAIGGEMSERASSKILF